MSAGRRSGREPGTNTRGPAILLLGGASMRNGNRAANSSVPELPRSGATALPGCSVEFRIWRSPRVPGLEVIHSSRHKHNYPMHIHENLELLWVTSGGCIITCRDRSCKVQTGEVGIVAPNEIHSGNCFSADTAYVAVHIPTTILQSFCDLRCVADNSGNPVPFKVMARDKARRVMPALVRLLCSDPPMEQLLHELHPLLAQVLVSQDIISAPELERVNMHPAVCAAKSIIRDHRATRMPVGRLARHVDLDMRYLISLFKVATGLTPHQFQIALRVELARSLIEDRLPLCEVADQSGFADQSHLNRHFKRQYGFTPGIFRESLVVCPNIVL